MNTKIKVSKLTSIFVAFIILIFSSSVFAEYYFAYPVPIAAGCCERVVTRYVVKHKVKHKVHKVKKVKKRHYVRHHRPRSCYNLTKYHAWVLPAPCSRWMVSCQPVVHVSGCGAYRETTVRYYHDEYIDDRATADDIYPELNIDN